MAQWLMFQRLLKDSFRDLIPIILVILFFQLAILEVIPDNWENTAIGLFIVGIGLAIFLQGLEIGIFPVGESLATEFSKKGSTILLLVFGFLIGYGTTIAEPALAVIAQKAAAISSGRIDAFWLREVVAISVGTAIATGVFRIIVGHPIHYYIITGYILVASITFFAPVEIVGLAYDLGGVTTSTVTVPLVAALGIGLASSIKGRNPMIDGFGLIAFASLTPMIFVQIYGIYVYTFVEATQVAQIVVEAKASNTFEWSVSNLASGLLSISRDVIPILAVILFFHYAILKQPVKNLGKVTLGFLLVILGLDAFIIGLEMGLFSLGETMAIQLTASDNVILIYSFGFAIGFATTMAEPALMAIAKKAKEISDGKINDFVLRIFVATGVAIGIGLGCYRIVQGDSIHYYVIVGYLIVIFLTAISPKYIIPIAFDSGGVTTSTVTVPLVAALGIGLASNIDGRSPLIDGFGLIAFASLFPMITVMIYGTISEFIGVKGNKQLERDFKELKQEPLLNTDKNATISVNGKDNNISLNLSFSAVLAMIPEDTQEDAILAAKEAGAGGVTILNASGTGLNDFHNFYRALTTQSDVCLIFITPDSMAPDILNAINEKLHMSSIGKGLVFSMPISQMRGISISEEYLSTIGQKIAV